MPDGGETDHQRGTGDYKLTSNRESTGEAALVIKMRRQKAWERCLEHTRKSVRGGNADAILVCGASADEDQAHKEQRRKQVERLREMKRSVEAMSDEDYGRHVQSIAGPEGAAFPAAESARQDAIRYYDRQIAELQQGAPVYTAWDNVKGVLRTPLRLAEGLWGTAKGVGNTAVDLANSAAAGEMMQSSDAKTRAEGERLAKQSGENLYNRGKSVVEGIFQILPNMAKQASAGNWGEPLGDTAASLIGGSRLLRSGERAGAGAATVGEPVSVVTGEYLETWRDFLIPGTFAFDGARYMGLKLGLPEGYASPLGPCQISMFDEIFSNPDHGQLVLHDIEGRQIWFDRPFNFLPSTNAGHPNLELKAPWLKQLTLKHGRVTKHFRQYPDKVYRLEKIVDLDGFELALARAEDGCLERIEGPDGLSLAFENDPQGRRTRVALIGTDGSERELAYYAYDHKGRMVAADCTYGMSVRYQWQADRELLASWHNVTRASITHFTYDEDGRVVHTATNGIWNDDRFRYMDGETVYLPGGSETAAQRFFYDEHENITAEIDALGGAAEYRYNKSGFRIATKDPNGNESRTKYDTHGNVGEHVDAEGRSTVYVWGDDGELHLVIDGAGNRKTYAHDVQSNVISETDAEGHTTRLSRDEKGRVVATEFPNGAIERRRWDGFNRLASVTDAKGNTTTFEYDVFNRLVATTDPLGKVTRREYCSGSGGFDVPSVMIRPDGVSVSRSFDGQGQLSAVTDGEGRRWTYSNGAFGVLQSITDPKGGTIAFDYDIEGRIVAVTNAVGCVYRYGRDAAGRVVEEEDFDGRVTLYRRDAAGQVVQKTKPDGAKLTYEYDKSGLVRRIESFDAKGVSEDVARFWYDGRGLPIQAENRAALVEFERDRNGRIVGETLNGKRIKSKRDAMGNRVLREIAGLGGGLVEYIRDPLGLVEKMVSGETEIVFRHDALGRETGRKIGDFRLDQRYDDAGHLVAQAGGSKVPSDLGLSPLGLTMSSSAGAHRGSGTVNRVYEYDRAFAPVRVDDGLWGEIRFDYDDNGQLVTAEGARGSERFSYDEARNLTGASSSTPFSSEASGYGPSFDATFGTITPSGKPTSWQRSPGGVVQIARGPRGERIRLEHDACGRLIERRVDRDGFRAQCWRYRWDAHDRLVGATQLNGEEWLFRYDPFGRRISKVRRFAEQDRERAARHWPKLVGGDGVPEPPSTPAGENEVRKPDPYLPAVGTTYLWDGAHMIAEAPLRLDGNIAWAEAVTWYFEGGESSDDDASHRLLAKELPAGARLPDGTVLESPTLFPVVCDHLGTPKEMFDHRGRLLWAADHHIWGEVRAIRTYGNLAAKPDYDRQPNIFACPWRFPGQYEDAETGLFYNRHRYYDPLTGQYVSPDPIGLAGGDRPQGYVGNPQGWIDPLGLSSTVNLTAADIRLSQSSVSPGVEAHAARMRQTDSFGDPVDVVRMSDGRLTSMDNRRIIAAHRENIVVKARVRGRDDPLTSAEAERFSRKIGRQVQVPKTWGEAIDLRIRGQNAGWRHKYPQGSPFTGSPE